MALPGAIMETIRGNVAPTAKSRFMLAPPARAARRREVETELVAGVGGKGVVSGHLFRHLASEMRFDPAPLLDSSEFLRFSFGLLR